MVRLLDLSDGSEVREDLCAKIPNDYFTASTAYCNQRASAVEGTLQQKRVTPQPHSGSASATLSQLKSHSSPRT